LKTCSVSTTSTSTCTSMGCCRIDRSRRSRNVGIRIPGVAGFYRLLEDVDFVRVETPYGTILSRKAIAPPQMRHHSWQCLNAKCPLPEPGSKLIDLALTGHGMQFAYERLLCANSGHSPIHCYGISMSALRRADSPFGLGSMSMYAYVGKIALA
jgi:hypothetical protein